MTSLSITTLPLPDGYLQVTEDEYLRLKRSIARDMIEQMSVYFGVRLLDHIVEIEIETPVTVAHYTGAWNGGIYGYRHSMHVIAAKAICLREAMQPEFQLYAEHIVKNAAALARALQARGFDLVSGGTDNHLM